MNLKSTILLVIIFLSACIDPLDIRIPVYERQLVIDGTVYEGAGPHRVSIFYAADLQAQRAEFKSKERVTNATVQIIADTQSFTLAEVEPGIYESIEGVLMGTIGDVYELQIQTADQKRYHSTQQLMEAAGSIDRLDFEVQEDIINIPETRKLRDGFSIWMDASAAAGSSGYLRWRYTGTYEIITQPELRTRVEASPSGLPIILPDPLPCSGHEGVGFELIRVAGCECCSCWVDEDDGKVRLANKDFIAVQNYRDVKLLSIPADRERFYIGYSLLVEQLSISADVYDFWQGVAAQQTGQGSLFQPNISIIRGNIVNVDDPNEKVLGIFSVSAVVSKRIYLDRLDIPYCVDLRQEFLECLQAPNVFFDDCRLKYERSTNIKPAFW
ncbi:MAG TPA: DUF4249 domain-containing protein [Cyclobacteriaceae bacterium]|nr:DUF4249 domain-containing protein [Cyclobacteriaceae bacterium]